jgi:hypothetical protein
LEQTIGTGVSWPPDFILVPQGAEYQAVCRGLRRVAPPKPLVVPIPVGPEFVTRYLEGWQEAGHFLSKSQPRVLLVGLCGSLSPDYKIGDIVVYQDCVYASNPSGRLLQTCNGDLTTWLHHNLKDKASLVRAITSDRLIYSATEKRDLGQMYAADVVDMEGFAVLETLSKAGVAVAMLRVISDNCHHNIPDLSSALSSDGSFQALPLAIGLLRQPIAATRLILGALRGLKVLQNVTTFLFTEHQ